MIDVRPAEQRGHADYGWLDTWHTFSFNDYYDRRHMGFRTLRVINDDRIRPGQGFGLHPHRDMEIITYVLEGSLRHKDSLGNGSIIEAGDVQMMSAGNGVMHSEFNPSQSDPVHLLQIWILPDTRGGVPTYAQRKLTRGEKLGGFKLIASPDGRDGSFKIKQNANVYAAIIEKDKSITLPVQAGRHGWLHVAVGQVQLDTQTLSAGDGAALSVEQGIKLTGLTESEVLLFDLS